MVFALPALIIGALFWAATNVSADPSNAPAISIVLGNDANQAHAEPTASNDQQFAANRLTDSFSMTPSINNVSLIRGGDPVVVTLTLRSNADPFLDDVYLYANDANLENASLIDFTFADETVVPTVAGTQTTLTIQAPAESSAESGAVVMIRAFGPDGFVEQALAITVEEPSFVEISTPIVIDEGAQIAVTLSVPYPGNELHDIELEIVPPDGLAYELSNHTLTPNGSVVLTLTDSADLAFGTYFSSIEVIGWNGETRRTAQIPLTVDKPTFNAVVPYYREYENIFLNTFGDEDEYTLGLVVEVEKFDWTEPISVTVVGSQILTPVVSVIQGSSTRAYIGLDGKIDIDTPLYTVFYMDVVLTSAGVTRSYPVHFHTRTTANATSDVVAGYLELPDNNTVVAGNSYTVNPSLYENGFFTFAKVMTETLPSDNPHISFDPSALPDDCSLINGNQVYCDGSSASFNSVPLELSVAADAPDQTIITHTLHSDQDPESYPDFVSENDVATATLRIVRASDLIVTLQADEATRGETLVYTATVTNQGPSIAENATLDLWTPDVAVTGYSTGCSPQSGTDAQCNLGTLAVGDVATVTITTLVPLDAGEMVAAEAIASSDSGNYSEANTEHATLSTPVTPPPPVDAITLERVASFNQDSLIYLSSVSDAVFSSDQPISVTIEYADINEAIIEETLGLYLWNGSEWVDAASTCDPAQEPDLDIDNNTLTVVVCTGGQFAIQGVRVGLTIEDLDKAEGDNGNTPFAFVVNRTSASDAAIWDYAVSGEVSAEDFGGTLPSGSVEFATGEVSKTVTINVIGDETVEADETFTVTLSTLTTGCSARDVCYTRTANGTIRNDDSATISIEDVTVDEAAGTAVLSMTQSALSSHDTTLNVETFELPATRQATVENMATAGEDYTAIDQTVTIPAGQQSVTVTVPIIDDSLIEETEYVTVTVAIPSDDTMLLDGISIEDGDARLTILDNDSGAVSIEDGMVAEGDTLMLTISLSGVRDTDTTMVVNSADHTATSGSDYTAIEGATATIAAGTLSTTVSIPIIDDAEVEGQETFSITLSSLTRADITFAKETARIIITEDDVEEGGSSTTTTPESGTTLVYSRTEGSEIAPVTTVDIPAEAVTETVTFVYTDIPTDTEQSNLLFAGERFTIDAYVDGEMQDSYTFASAVTVTIHYSDTALADLDLETLVLEFWNGSEWIDAAATCYEDNPSSVPADAYIRDLENSTLTVPICHLTEFGLFGEPLAELVIDHSTGKPGSTFVLTGTGFLTNSVATVALDWPDGRTSMLNTVSTDANGQVVFEVPTLQQTPTGVFTLTLTTDNGSTASVQFSLDAAATCQIVPSGVELPIVPIRLFYVMHFPIMFGGNGSGTIAPPPCGG